MRTVILVALALSVLRCSPPVCAKRCAPMTEVEVVTESGDAVTQFSGSGSAGDAFVFGCGGAAAPDGGTADGGALGTATCDGNKLHFFGSGNAVSLELSSPQGSFNGVVTTTFEPSPDADPSGCSGGCGLNRGHVVVR